MAQEASKRVLVRGLTEDYHRLVNALEAIAFISPAFDPKTIPEADHASLFRAFRGIWDTGASSTVISDRVVQALGLQQVGVQRVHGADGEYEAPIYYVNFVAPNKIAFHFLRVTGGRLHPQIDFLIGMDIIGQGDLLVCNHGGKTTLSFRIPSIQSLDLRNMTPGVEEEVRRIPAAPVVRGSKVGRNDPCPCGSGKKAKRCCQA